VLTEDVSMADADNLKERSMSPNENVVMKEVVTSEKKEEMESVEVDKEKENNMKASRDTSDSDDDDDKRLERV
jgi:hypothetical protein